MPSRKKVAKSIRPTPTQLQEATWFHTNLWGQQAFRYAALDLRICKNCWQPFCTCNIPKEHPQYTKRMQRNEEAYQSLVAYEQDKVA